jgi:hypothetical protein
MAGRPASPPLTTYQDLGQGFNETSQLLAASSPLFESQQIHPAMKESPIVGQLGFNVVSQIAAAAKFIEVKGFDIRDEVGGKHLIESSVPLGGVGGHVRQITGRHL